jgi:hypothetical protein
MLRYHSSSCSSGWVLCVLWDKLGASLFVCLPPLGPVASCDVGRRLAAPASQRRTQRCIPACGCGLIGSPSDVALRAYQYHQERRVGRSRKVDSAGPSAPDCGSRVRGCEKHEPPVSQDLVQPCLSGFPRRQPDIGCPPSSQSVLATGRSVCDADAGNRPAHYGGSSPRALPVSGYSGRVVPTRTLLSPSQSLLYATVGYWPLSNNGLSAKVGLYLL